MSTKCWLFPFTHGVDARAIERVIQLAASADASLCAVALLPSTARAEEKPSEQVRLDHLMQANDFFEVVRRKAAQSKVTFECRRVSTNNVVQSVTALAQEMQCSSVVIMLNGHKSVLLDTPAVKELLLSPTVPLMLVRPLETATRSQSGMRSWFQQRFKQSTHAATTAHTSPKREQITTS